MRGDRVPRRDPARAATPTAGLSTGAGYLAATYGVRRRPDDENAERLVLRAARES
ncbi:hypothetical protein [Streptomyces hirsutus]|uniref:hypothetical protein n=1 Tax=Streptomyces hirsutus TaxID=35620 RepID=UPI0014704585|nr:hypothetical protein [Streptomyces hirsutus]